MKQRAGDREQSATKPWQSSQPEPNGFILQQSPAGEDTNEKRRLIFKGDVVCKFRIVLFKRY
ncbi:hypothetical protein [Roseimaritima multifibrata]|uniref:hypothetical protein n=1 Tax=Roseimaritima multifibrata TaxID=1930274 RepID=UPI0011A869EA|nr:hypothetical protein [Roseimaritima multifibrata]